MPASEPTPAVVLLSGGLDSSVLLHYVVKTLARQPVHALSLRYGQKHGRELEMAARQVASLTAVQTHTILDLDCFPRLAAGTSSLVADGAAVPDLDNLDPAQCRQPPTYVPNRNMILLSLAAAFAESRDVTELYYGAQAQDCYGYWDCTAEFVERLNATLALNRRNPVRIIAPFVDQPKSAGVRLGIELGVDFALTWSCYRGGAQPCGRCPTCVERQRAFAAAGCHDPLANA